MTVNTVRGVLIMCVMLSGTTLVSAGSSNEGVEFAFALPPTEQDVSSELIFTSREAATVTLSAISGTDVIEVGLTGASYLLPANERVITGIEEKVLYIEATAPVSVHITTAEYTSALIPDATLLRPLDQALDTEFYLAGQDKGSSNSAYRPRSFYMIVSTEDATSVQVYTTSGDLDVDVTLQQYEVYTRDAWHEEEGHELDFTGMRVTSDKPVAVFSGHGCSEVATVSNPARGMFEAIPNVASLGDQYTTFALEYGSDEDGGSEIRVVSTVDDTLIEVSELGISQQRDAGDFLQFDYDFSRTGTRIVCSNPCMAVQYIKTNNQAGDASRGISSFMIVLVPDSDFHNDVIFATPVFAELFSDTDVAISIVTDYLPSVGPYLNGDDLSSLDWKNTDDGLRWCATLEIDLGFYQLNTAEDEEGFAAYLHTVYGSYPFYSMGFLLGYDAGDTEPTTETPTSTSTTTEPPTSTTTEGGSTTTTEPGDEERRPPLHEVILLGDFYSMDDSDFTIECIQELNDNLLEKASGMIPALNNKLGTEMCLYVSPADVLIVSVSALLMADGTEGTSEIAYLLKSLNHVSVSNFTSCSAELSVHLQDFDNWGQPVIPPADGCPAPVFEPQYFYDGSTGNDWVCISPNMPKESAFLPYYMDSTPGYSLSVYDNFTTVTGDDLDSSCTQQYRSDWQATAISMVFTMNDMISAGQLCAGDGGKLSVLTATTSLSAQGNVGSLTAMYFMTLTTDHMLFEDVYPCVDDIFLFLEEHINWGSLPLLPQPPGCPALNFGDLLFYHNGENWECSIVLDTRPGEVM